MSARRSRATATPTSAAAASTPDPAAPDDQAVPVCKKTQGFVGFNPLGSEEANISKTETE